MAHKQKRSKGHRSIPGSNSVDPLSTTELGEMRTILSSENTQQMTHDLRRLVGRFLSLYDEKIHTVYTESMLSQWSHAVSTGDARLSQTSSQGDRYDTEEEGGVSPSAITDSDVDVAPV